MQKQQRMKTGESRRNGNYSGGERTNIKNKYAERQTVICLKEGKLYLALLSFVGK